jgi:hypothetical protein
MNFRSRKGYAMETSRLQIRRFRAHYLVSAQHPSPEQIKDRLDEGVMRHLAPMLSAACSQWFSETNPSVWVIRRLEIEVGMNAAWERDQLARAITMQLGRTLGATLEDGADQANVRRFPDRAAYLASFLCDLAAGAAWGCWYYESFAGLRLLPTSTALCTAICDQPDTGLAALRQLADEELLPVLRALGAQDARRILDNLAESVTAGDELRCCQTAWTAWQTIEARLFTVGDEWRQSLYLFLAANREQEDVGGLSLKNASLALLRLARKLASDPAEQYERVLTALTGGEVAALYAVAGATDAERLLPLLRCPPAWVRNVAQTLTTRSAGEVTEENATTPRRRDTAFGGAFLLLPMLDELPLIEATRDWPHADEAAAITLARFLLLVKCCGQNHAQRAFYDPLLRDLLLIPPGVSPEGIYEWQSRITSAHLQTFHRTLIGWQRSRGAIGGEKQVLASGDLRGRPIAALIDGARGLWLLAASYPSLRSQKLGAQLRNALSQLERDDGVLLCDSSLFTMLHSQFPTLKMLSIDDEAAQMTLAEDPVNGILARLNKLPDDLERLALPSSFRLARPFDLSLSIAAQHLLRAFAWRLPGFAESNLPYLSRNFLEFAGSVEEEAARRVVRLSRPPLHLVLGMTGMTRQTYRLSWLDERPLALFQET